MKKTIVLLLVAITITTVNAQLGTLKKNFKGSGGKKTVPMIYNSKMPVSVDYQYILDDLELNTDGLLSHGFIKATFPPVEDENGTIDYDGKYRFFVQLTKDGNEVFKKPCKEQNTSDNYKIFIPDPNNEATLQANNYLTEGKYSMNYFLDDSLFYSIDFEVKALSTDDPYAKDAKKYMIDGPWNNLAYISIEGNDNRLIFNTYLRHESMETLKKCIYWIDLEKGGKVVASTNKATDKGKSYFANLTCKWKEQSNALKMVKEDGNMGVDYASLNTLDDGDYTLKSSFDGKEFQYSFTIKDGKIVPSGNQVFVVANSKHYIEGMGKNFFFAKQ